MEIDGVVDLAAATAAHGTGEITLVDGEQVVPLVTAAVSGRACSVLTRAANWTSSSESTG